MAVAETNGQIAATACERDGRVATQIIPNILRDTLRGVALENVGRFRPAIEAVLKERDRLGRELSRMPGLKVYPTEANFFTIEVPVSPRLVFEDLYGQGILIRDVSSYPMLSKCLRISVGTPDENNRLLSALHAALNARA